MEIGIEQHADTTEISLPSASISSQTSVTDRSSASAYRAVLQRMIAQGAARATEVLRVIHLDQPRDQIVRTRGADFGVDLGTLRVKIGDDSYTPSHFALGQIAECAGIPTSYLHELSAPTAKPWQSALAAEILREHYHNLDQQRVLVRSVRGQPRGWLSDRFRRLDSRPLVDALAEEATALGAISIDGMATETRVSLRVILPQIVEVLPSEFICIGGALQNSDVGNGTHSFRVYAVRVVCSNGLTAQDVLRQVHLGGRLSDEVEFSDRTHRLDTEASASALRDVVRSALGPSGRECLIESIRQAAERDFTKARLSQTTRSLPKSVQQSVADAFTSEDVINLPPGQTAWRASNALSWIARNTDNAELKLDLERLAGSLVERSAPVDG